MQKKFLYRNNSQSLLQSMIYQFENERRYVLESETGDADISYYKMKKSSVDKKYTIGDVKKRATRLVLIPTAALDINSFTIASGANSAHFLDAEEIRIIEISLGYCVITIHDSYLIDFNNCTKLIDVKLAHYQDVLNKLDTEYTIANIFILL